MKRMIVFSLAGGAVVWIALAIYADVGRAWSLGNLFTSDAERHRSRAALMRERAALVDAENRARIDFERFESDAAFKAYVLEQARDRDRLMQTAYRQIGAAQGRASLFGGVSMALAAVATVFFYMARKFSRKLTEAESTLAGIQNRLADATDNGAISAAVAHRIATGQRLLTPLR